LCWARPAIVSAAAPVSVAARSSRREMALDIRRFYHAAFAFSMLSAAAKELM